MANSAFRLVDDDFDFEDLDEIDDIDLNGLANPEDGGATAGAPEASTGEAGYGGNVDYANNTGYVDAGYAGDAGMGGEGDANVPMPTMSDNMEGTHSFFLEPNPGFDTSMFADPAAPAAPVPTQADENLQAEVLGDGTLENLDGVLEKSLFNGYSRKSVKEYVDSLNNNSKMIRTSFEKQISDLSKERADLSNECNVLRAQIDEIEGKKRELEDHIATTEREDREQDDRINDLMSTVDESRRQAEEALARVEQMKGECAAREKALSENEAELDKLRKDVQSKTEEIKIGRAHV